MLEVQTQQGPVRLTHHAQRRYHERACPDLTFEASVQRLIDRAPRCGIRAKRPGWAFRPAGLKHRILTEGYLVLGAKEGQPAVAFPLTVHGENLVATTCLVQGWDRNDKEKAA